MSKSREKKASSMSTGSSNTQQSPKTDLQSSLEKGVSTMLDADKSYEEMTRVTATDLQLQLR